MPFGVVGLVHAMIAQHEGKGDCIRLNVGYPDDVCLSCHVMFGLVSST